MAQIVFPAASAYERKCQRVDSAALAREHRVTVIELMESVRDLTARVASSGAQVAHVYGPSRLPAGAFMRFPIPYVASGEVYSSGLTWRKPVPPAMVVSPLAVPPLPEAVEDAYFVAGRDTPQGTSIASFRRPSIINAVEQTMARIHRFRDDVQWTMFERAPTPEDLAGVDLWVDPAVDPEDFDGFVAEAQVSGLPVVASRTPINSLRLEKGRTGMLVPPADPNEATHAILSALFKPEVAQPKLQAARQTASKYQPRLRLRALLQMYETLTR